MKQILQNLKDGKTELVDVPCPGARAGHLLIQSRVSLISAGTERMLIDFGRANFIDKARQQPDKVRQVVEKVRTDGLAPTLDAVRSKLDQPVALGYCNVGTVIEARGEGREAKGELVRMKAGSGDTVTISLRFVDGSIGTIHYFANGHKAVAKERLEVFCGGRVLRLDNFRKLKGYGWPGFRKMNLWRQDKRQEACVAAFVEAVKNGGPSPIPFAEIVEVSRAVLALAADEHP